MNHSHMDSSESLENFSTLSMFACATHMQLTNIGDTLDGQRKEVTVIGDAICSHRSFRYVFAFTSSYTEL